MVHGSNASFTVFAVTAKQSTKTFGRHAAMPKKTRYNARQKDLAEETPKTQEDVNTCQPVHNQ